VLDVESLVVVVDEYLGHEPLVVVESLGPLRDGFVLYLSRLLTYLNISLCSMTLCYLKRELFT
jgi:hypothetical protein